jgi:periplasmic protein TonB
MAIEPKNSLVDVFSANEVAQAAGVPVSRVEALVAAGQLRPIADSPGFFALGDAVGAVRGLRADGGRSAAMLFDQPTFQHASPKLPVAVSTAIHAGIAATLILASTIDFTQAAQPERLVSEPVTTRLVFLATPGPGGGGGGGGLRQRTPPPKAMRVGKSKLDSPLPPREKPKPVEPVAKPPDPPPPPPEKKPEPLPPVVAPVATVAANDRDQAGLIDQPAPPKTDSRGSGTGGGVGSGTGTGLGSGDGTGIGPGSGGGMGGGPYRPGSGITPPKLLREVKADYTDEARRRNVEGEVVLEIVVRRDGSVGDVKVLDGLGSGLNERAISAVKRWQFSPAKRLGAPVDVIVEVAVEFKLR